MATEQGGERSVASPDALGAVARRVAHPPSPGRAATSGRRKPNRGRPSPPPWPSPPPPDRARPLVGSAENAPGGGDTDQRRAPTSATAERRAAPPTAFRAGLPGRVLRRSGDGVPRPNAARPSTRPRPAGSDTTSRTAHPRHPDRRPVRPGGRRPVGTSTRPDSTKDHDATTTTVPPTTGATGTTSAVSGYRTSRHPSAPGRRTRVGDLRATGPSWGEPVRVRRRTGTSLLRPALRGAAS